MGAALAGDCDEDAAGFEARDDDCAAPPLPGVRPVALPPEFTAPLRPAELLPPFAAGIGGGSAALTWKKGYWRTCEAVGRCDGSNFMQSVSTCHVSSSSGFIYIYLLLRLNLFVHTW